MIISGPLAGGGSGGFGANYRPYPAGNGGNGGYGGGGGGGGGGNGQGGVGQGGGGNGGTGTTTSGGIGVAGTSGEGRGGAILIAAGSLALYEHCTFINNKAIGGSGVSGYGGAIYIDGTSQAVIGVTVNFLYNSATCASCISIISHQIPPTSTTGTCHHMICN